MMTDRIMPSAACDDAKLISESLSGNRDAFEQIVARYQSLVCSLAYSATGSLSQSEDLAQETFIAAWKQLAGLRESEKLRAWLCGIARNLINNSLRRQRREPAHGAEPCAAGVDCPFDEAAVKIARHLHPLARDAFSRHYGAIKVARDNVVGFYIQLAAQPTTIFEKAALCESGVPHCAGHASVCLNVQLDEKIGLLAPGHDDPAVSFPMTNLGWGEDAFGCA
jgi:RNA polymerase sigma factor (sigma-70 family)